MCKNLVKIGPVVSEVKILIEIALPMDVVVRLSSSYISVCIEPIFAIFSPYESSLRAYEGSVLYFEFVKGHCHGNQLKSKNWPISFVSLRQRKSAYPTEYLSNFKIFISLSV